MFLSVPVIRWGPAVSDGAVRLEEVYKWSSYYYHFYDHVAEI